MMSDFKRLLTSLALTLLLIMAGKFCTELADIPLYHYRPASLAICLRSIYCSFQENFLLS